MIRWMPPASPFCNGTKWGKSPHGVCGPLDPVGDFNAIADALWPAASSAEGPAGYFITPPAAVLTVQCYIFHRSHRREGIYPFREYLRWGMARKNSRRNWERKTVNGAHLYRYAPFLMPMYRSVPFICQTNRNLSLRQTEIYILFSFLHQVHLPHSGHFNNLLLGVCINKVISL